MDTPFGEQKKPFDPPLPKFLSSSLTLLQSPPQKRSPHVTTEPSAKIAAKARAVLATSSTGDLLNLAQLPLDCGAVATTVTRTPRDHTAIRQDRCKGAVGSTDLGHLAVKNYNSWDGIIMDGLFHGKSIDKN